MAVNRKRFALNSIVPKRPASIIKSATFPKYRLDANPELVRTLSAPPPRGAGRVRLVEFKDVDLQPCGGTHVASTSGIGPVRIQKVEKKGKMNRRIIVVFEE